MSDRLVPRKDNSFGIVPVARRPEADFFLLVQHKAGHWGFPKGHAEPGESAQVAACREFEEETGIKAYELLSAEFVERYHFLKSGQPFEKIVIYFPAFVRSETVNYQQEEIKDYTWLIYEEALTKLTFAQSRQVLAQVQHYLQRIGKGRLEEA